MPESKKILKIAVVGDSYSGKTCLLLRYVEGRFSKDYMVTLAADLGFKDLNVGGEPVKLCFWDFGGAPHFKNLHRFYYVGCSGVVYVFDVTRRETFEHLDEWRKEVAEICGDIPGVIVGSKVNLSPREVTRSEGERYAESVGMPYIEASALTGKNVDKVFRTIASLVAKK